MPRNPYPHHALLYPGRLCPIRLFVGSADNRFGNITDEFRSRAAAGFYQTAVRKYEGAKRADISVLNPITSVDKRKGAGEMQQMQTGAGRCAELKRRMSTGLFSNSRDYLFEYGMHKYLPLFFPRGRDILYGNNRRNRLRFCSGRVCLFMQQFGFRFFIGVADRQAYTEPVKLSGGKRLGA